MNEMNVTLPYIALNLELFPFRCFCFHFNFEPISCTFKRRVECVRGNGSYGAGFFRGGGMWS